MSLYKKFKTDSACESEGVWLDYGEGTRIRIARAGGSNKRFLKSAEKFRRRFKRQLDLDLLSNDVASREAVKIYADSVVLDWEGVTDEDDNELDCTRENVTKVLTDLPDLFIDLQQMALNASLFREEIDAEAAGN